MVGESQLIPVGEELPPMHRLPSSNGSTLAQHQGHPRPAKEKPTRRKTGDRFAVANAFADYGARLVDPTAQAVWWILWRETKPNGLAQISFGRMAECTGRSRRTAVRAIGRLTKARLLTVVRRGSLSDGPSTYRAHGVPKGQKTWCHP
jgi:hypothetical protein